MIPYSTYRTSSCDWIDRIPANWRAQRIKSIFGLRDERNFKPLNEVNLISLYTGLGVRQHKDIEHTTGNKARNADGYKVVYPDDIVVNILLCWMGAIGRSDYHGVTSPAYDIYKPKTTEINTQYYNYLMRTPMFAQQCYKVGKGIMAMRWRTYSPQFSNIVIPVPPRDEQDQIVRFLDWKVSSINKLINIKHKEISELNESLNTKLRDVLLSVPNVKEVPLKRICSVPMTDGPHETPTFVDSGIPFVSAEASHDGRIHLDECRGFITREQHEVYCQKVRPHKNDIFIVKSGSTTGKTVMVDFDEEFSIWSPLALVRCNNLAMPRYVFFYCTSVMFQKQVRDNWSFGTQPNIGMGVLENLRLPLPEIEEQRAIVDTLDAYWSKVLQVKCNLKKQIEEFQSLKTRIIADAVTGKINVRGIEIPEYEFVDEDADADNEGDGEGDTEEQED